MNESLRGHLSQPEYNLPKKYIDEVCAMFSFEAGNLLDSLSALKPEVREVALNALRDYHSAMNKNNATFTQVATVLTQGNGLDSSKPAANDDRMDLAA